MSKGEVHWGHAIKSSCVPESFLTGDVQENLSRFIRHRYAEFWQKTVQMDWFNVYVYQSEDTENLRDLDVADDEPKLASYIADLVGIDIQPQDLLVGIGKAMTSLPGANDPDLWAAIDIGETVCRLHYGESADIPYWECRVSLLACASIVAFVANRDMRGALFMQRPEDVNGGAVPKIYRLVDYLIWIAAGEKYLGREQIDRSEMSRRFRKEHELFANMLKQAADAALAMDAAWSSGPLTTATIAERGHLLLTEVLRNMLPVPQSVPIAIAEQPYSVPPCMRI